MADEKKTEEKEIDEVMKRLCSDKRKVTVGDVFVNLMETLETLESKSEIFARLRNRVSERFYDEFLESLLINLAGAAITTGLPDEKKREVWNGELLTKLAEILCGNPPNIVEVIKEDGKTVGKA